MPPPLPYADVEKRRSRRHGSVAIIANGFTAGEHDLSKIPCPVITMNRSFELRWPDVAHVVAEEIHWKTDPGAYDRLHREGKLFCIGAFWGIGHRLRIAHTRIVNAIDFSEDLTRGVIVGMGQTGSVAYVALQLAAYMGFNPIYFLGLDLHGKHYHDRWPTNESKLLMQNNLFLRGAEILKKRGIEVFNVGSPETRCTAFPKLTFEEAFL